MFQQRGIQGDFSFFVPKTPLDQLFWFDCVAGERNQWAQQCKSEKKMRGDRESHLLIVDGELQSFAETVICKLGLLLLQQVWKVVQWDVEKKHKNV